MKKKTVYFDVETSGLDPKRHEIIQIAAVAVHDELPWGERWWESISPDVSALTAEEFDEKFKEMIAAGGGALMPEFFATRVQFDRSIASQDALEVNGYTEEAWKDAIPQLQARAQFADFLRRHSTVEMISKRTGRPYHVAQLAGHNAASFDGPFIREWFSHEPSEFMPASFLILDTLQLAMWWRRLKQPQVENLKLETLAEYFGVGINAHDALSDVIATSAIARIICDGMGVIDE